MRLILKIILIPISLTLLIITAFLTFLLGIGTTILYLLMLFCVLGAIGSFVNGDKRMAIEALVLAFLVSPYGLPAIAASVIGLIETVNDKIREI